MGFLAAMDRSLAPLVQGLETRSHKHALIAANIANADTPGYRASDVTFDRALTNARLRLVATHPQHRAGAGLPVRDAVVLTGGAARRDGNDVDVDREMAKLARNQIEYQFLARRLGRTFAKLKEAITGRATP